MKGQRTRQSILDHAVDLASTDGLEGLTIGRLADELQMSKSGLFAHFGSKEDLQLATIQSARQRFVDAVLRPAFAAPRGYPRLMAICRAWLDYVTRGVFPGGCFFAAASFEFDGRPGPVRDAIRAAMDAWIATLEKAIRLTIEEGHFDRSVDATQLAFELNSLFFGANFATQLGIGNEAVVHAQRAIELRLSSLRVKSSRRPPRARRRSAAAPRRGQPGYETRRR